MDNTLFYIGLAIAGIATIISFIFNISQSRKRQQVKDIPLRFEEWRAQYRTKRWYIFIAQMAGIIIAIVGLNL